MNIRLYIILLSIFLSVSLSATDKLLINYDYASFYSLGGDPDNYIELYFSYPIIAYTMSYNTTDSIYSSNIIFEFRMDSLDNEILNEKWEIPFSFKQSQIKDIPQDFYGLQRFFLYAGEYKGKLIVTDINGNRQYQDTFSIIVKKIDTNRLGLSSIQIANNIIHKSKAIGNESELFYKNQHYIYPNPQREISADMLTLHIYSEIYNVMQSDSLEVKYEIRNAKNIVEVEYTKYKRCIGNAMVETLSYPIDALPSGIYTLILKVIGKDTIVEKKNFYVINHNIELKDRTYYTEDEQFDLSEFATMNEDKVNLEFAQFEVLATRDEIILWKKLTELKAKQRFLFQFWFMRNSNIGDSFNDKLLEYRDRLKYVNIYFSYAGKNNGWNSDRGKIYIKFGPPDHKEEFPITPTQHPYYIWTYHSIEGGATFIFADIIGLENYKLIHSTHSGYLKNYNWMNIVNRNNIIRE
jgi:GWxTD domain-containing protein